MCVCLRVCYPHLLQLSCFDTKKLTELYLGHLN